MMFGEKLMELRKSKGFSQEELGFQLNVTRQTVSKWETGQTTPEMDKLVELSKLFHISIDELVGNADTEKSKSPVFDRRAFHYEYKSKRIVFGLPLVHVNVGVGLRRAKGIIAIGTIAQGFISLGAISVGLISLGAVSLGLLALGAACLGVLSIGGVAIGALALGGIAIGVVSVGGLSLGVYSVGGYASASRIAMGGYAQGHIAIGDVAKGEFAWEKISQLTSADYDTIRATILREYPNIWKWVLNIFV